MKVLYKNSNNKMYKYILNIKLNYLLLLALVNWNLSTAETTKCAPRKTQFGMVCVCTADYCDYLEEPQPSNVSDIVMVSSSKAGLRFEVSTGHFGVEETFRIGTKPIVKKQSVRNITNFEEATLLVDNDKGFVQVENGLGKNNYVRVNKSFRKPAQINVNRNKTYQNIVGFGGAFTGAVSHLLQQVSEKLQDHIYKSYYHKHGIAFNLLRMPIGGCDFDLEPWAYNEYPRNDAQLSNFTKLDARDEQKIEQLKRLKEVAELEKFKIMASAWSSPTWMKSNEDWTGFSYLKPEYYQTWADYHLKFLELMDAKNMPIWAITTGNEPLNGVIGWFFVSFMSLGWTPTNQAIWLSDNLGPTIKNSKYKNVLIFSNDDQRYTYPAWFRAMNASRVETTKYLDGLAVHWYWDEFVGPELIDKAHSLMPDKLILNTESCIGDKPYDIHGPMLGSWERGVQYIRAFMQDLQHNFNGWIDWNLILDENGGPNYVANYVDAPVILNTNNKTEFYKQPIFYALGHFSKFIPEGSMRIDTQMRNFNLDVVGFKRPDNRIVIVLLNSDPAAMDVVLNDSIRGNILINIPARSVHTIIYN